RQVCCHRGLELARSSGAAVGRADDTRTFSTAVVDRRLIAVCRCLAHRAGAPAPAPDIGTVCCIESGGWRGDGAACAVVRAGTGGLATQPVAGRDDLLFLSTRPLERAGC